MERQGDASLQEEPKYTVMSDVDHILHRPDTYLGSIHATTATADLIESYAVETTTPTTKKTVIKHIVSYDQEISYNPGIYQLFEELITNAMDEARRDATCTAISVTVDRDSGVIMVSNDGRGIQVERMSVVVDGGPPKDLYMAEVIFGVPRSGSNFDDTIEREVAGRNGLGAKAVNIFSTRFEVEVASPSSGKQMSVVWTDNMKTKGAPKVKTMKNKRGYVRITFHPDLARFGIASTNDPVWLGTCSMIQRRMYDVAMLTSESVRVTFNDVKLGIRTFKQYASALMGEDRKVYAAQTVAAVTPSKKRKIPGGEVDQVGQDIGQGTAKATATSTWCLQVAVGFNRGGHKQLSWVNGVPTAEGGTHVDFVRSKVIDSLVQVYSARRGNAKAQMQPKFFKDNIFLIVNATVTNPAFASQTKTKLTAPTLAALRSSLQLPSDFLRRIASSDIMDAALEVAAQHEEKLIASKESRDNRKSVRGIPKLDDANDAGTSKGHKCVLFLTEGDSAKATVVAGLSVLGRARYGVFPLKGKPINARVASEKQLGCNTELSHIKRILGLETGVRYTSTKNLRYGKVCIATDADSDGAHIKGLILNMFEARWPELIELGFISSLITPIVKATFSQKSRGSINFYTQAQLLKWQTSCTEADRRGVHLKYYKGLGTSTPAEARVIFEGFRDGKNDVSFAMDGVEDREQAAVAMNLAFGKTQTEARKQWLMDAWAGTLQVEPKEGAPYLDSMDRVGKKAGVPEFVHGELIEFSKDNVERAIPHIMDGFKPSQRKIIFACNKKGIQALSHDESSLNRAGVRVTQLAGVVTATAAYHHGEASLFGAICNLANDFMGSNQVRILAGVGQFGTRLMGGRDAASARYIYTCLAPTYSDVFIKDDDDILDYLEDEGQSVEPAYMAPVIPLVLVNGAHGIATGFSTDIPCFELNGIVRNLRSLADTSSSIQGVQGLKVGFRGFKGVTRLVDAGTWEVCGVACMTGNSGRCVRITELPLGEWTTPYKEWLNEQDWISNVRNNSSSEEVDFEVTTREPLNEGEQDVLDKFKLRKRISTRNMHLFDEAGCIQRYDTPEEILIAWYKARIALYDKRKVSVLASLDRTIKILANKVRYVSEVVHNTVRMNIPRADMERDLEAKGYERAPGDGGYGYLFDIKMAGLTSESILKLEAEHQDKMAQRCELSQKSREHLFLDDLERLCLTLGIESSP